ncbi:STAS domain-containing protein [Conexibacter sp. CPCC 206217]|uniref:STAS domain-containing protein n=1 Tax=Conexibacter sp. CPCC 206217 TaxID=3064574 RepID=UPI00271D13FB|nr:STAS domain-containing protein [Conexibacter sp. CPCC 206217]MDO8211602.1 STAS domain-containing protein [Conexibacter sp. CPCC 206217]
MTRSSHSHVQPTPFGLDDDLLDDGQTAVLAVRGELDLFTAPELKTRLRDHTDGAGPTQDLVVDLSGCAFVDASGCQVLLRAARRLSAQSRRLVVVNTSGSNARILNVMGLDELFPVVESRAAAVAVLQAPRG